MVNIFTVPGWFFGYDVLLEFFFAIITFVVGLYSLKIYKLTNHYRPKLFGLAFILISISYLIQSFMNYVIISKLNESICGIVRLHDVNLFNAIGVYSHMVLFIAGLVTLTYMTFGIRNRGAYSLLLIISILSVLLSMNKLYQFYLISSILLIYISTYYFYNYISKKKKMNSFIVLMAFLALLFGNIGFIFSVDHTYYVLGHLLELVAYFLILINLVTILKKK